MGRDRPSVAIIGTRGYPSYYGGFETAVRKLAPYLVEDGWDVRVYGRPGAVRLDDPERDERVESVETQGRDSKSLSTLTFGLTACWHAVRHKPDVALVMNVANGFWLPLLKLRGIKVVVNVDGIEWHRQKWSRLGKLVFKAGGWFTAKLAEHLVFDARAIGLYWNVVLGRAGTYIPYGGDAVSDLPWRETEIERNGYVLMVARFVPENTVLEFFDAAEQLTRDIDIVIVGSADPEDPVQVRATALAAGNDRVHLLGHVSDDQRLLALWQNAAVYYHGHSVGGTNPALVQAMALGANIVARDTVYNREVLDEAGTFFDADTESITRTVRAALEPGASRGARAAFRADEKFRWDHVCAAYAKVLRAQLPARFGPAASDRG